MAARLAHVFVLGLVAATLGCASTVPLEQHQALEARLGELQEGQELLRGELGELEERNEQLTAMVAAQRMIIRDLRCRPQLTIEAE